VRSDVYVYIRLNEPLEKISSFAGAVLNMFDMILIVAFGAVSSAQYLLKFSIFSAVCQLTEGVKLLQQVIRLLVSKT